MALWEQTGPTAVSYRLAEGGPTVPPAHTCPAAPLEYDSSPLPPVDSRVMTSSPLLQLASPSGSEMNGINVNRDDGDTHGVIQST